MTEAGPFWHDVTAVDGQPVLHDRHGPHPIMLGPDHPAQLSPPWSPRGAYSGCTPFHLIELHHDSGLAAFWLLDQDFRIVGSNEIPPEIDAAFDAAFLQTLSNLATNLWRHPEAAHDPAIAAYLRLTPPLRRRLFARLPAAAFTLPHPDIIDLFRTETAAWPIQSDHDGPVVLQKSALVQALLHDLQSRFLEACRTRQLRWPALAGDGTDVPAHAIFFRSDFGLLRCLDPTTGLLFHVVLMGADLGAVAIAIPAIDTVFAYYDHLPGLYRGALTRDPGHLPALFARHLLCGPAEFPGWLASTPQSIASFTWPEAQAHLGHFLWNEASGLERAVESLDPAQYPAILNLAGPSQTEFYAPLETLYPEFAGEIRNEFADTDAMQLHCYRHALQPIRLSGTRVTAAIRRRVMAVVAADPEVALLARLLGPPDPAIPIIVLGLRLSDRTHADLGGFYARAIARLLTHVPRLTVVIDGLNARPGRAAGTFRVFSGGPDPGDLQSREKSLVAGLRQATAGLPVDIVDCVGIGMRLNLFWIDRARMFIAPWGAGLVKYRWVCNKPGFVFTSRNNLTQPDHLPIYHLPLFMDDPAPIEFADPAHVTDLRRPDEQLDAQGRDLNEQQGGLSAVNFTLDEAPVLARIEALFEATK